MIKKRRSVVFFMKRNTSKNLIGIILISTIVAFNWLDLDHLFTLENLKDQQTTFSQYYAEHIGFTLLSYFLVYVVIAAFPLPGAAILSLAGGALFGLVSGVFVVSFASSIGATLAFLASRFLFKDFVQKQFGEKLSVINEKTNQDGAFYLFGLRLVPLFPFFAINLLMGLTPIRKSTFYLVSQIGMLPATFVYVLAGTQLAKINTLQDILSPKLILSFAVLGVFPFIAKKFMSYLQKQRAR